MHSNLAKHLHSEECIGLIEAYDKCNKDNKYMRYVGICSDFQNKMTACIQNELKRRRNIGAENVKRRELDHYMKQNPQFAEKMKLLEDLKQQKEKEKN